MKRFVLSDAHGAKKAIEQCLKRCGFNNEEDQLIFLGDVVDGWSESKQSIDLLKSIKNLIYILGNHDQWTFQFYTGQMNMQDEFSSWQHHGGLATRESFGIGKEINVEYLHFLNDALPYYITDDNKLFVHAGFDPSIPIEKQDVDSLIWNRDFIKKHYNFFKTKRYIEYLKYKEIYVGHTPTISLDSNQKTPLKLGNVYMVDTGAAFGGKLSIMDIDTKEIWQSDIVKYIYPNEKGRNQFTWEQEKIMFGI